MLTRRDIGRLKTNGVRGPTDPYVQVRQSGLRIVRPDPPHTNPTSQSRREFSGSEIADQQRHGQATHERVGARTH